MYDAEVTPEAVQARRVSLRGIVQGVGMRPFTYRLAQSLGIKGWVANSGRGLEIHAEGSLVAIESFVRRLTGDAPPVAQVAHVTVSDADVEGEQSFRISASDESRQPTTHISPDLPVCAECLRELFDPHDRRWRYPYINCAHCGPRFSIVESLPYDRARTTMAAWKMCAECAREFHDPADRRFHAQPTACPSCGPHYVLQRGGDEGRARDWTAIESTAQLLAAGEIVAIKGLGGYHLACDARNAAAVADLRARKYRKEKPFALMAKDIAVARAIVRLTPESAALLTSNARPIVLAPACAGFRGVAPDHCELGVMLPYAPLHYLLFDAGAPDVLVMTSGNRSSEPIAITENEAFDTLGGIASAFLVGERAIARRVDDSVVHVTRVGPAVLRHSRGYAPRVAAYVPTRAPVLAVGADLKNSITLVVDGEAIVSQHIGDLEHYRAYETFQETVRDLLHMYRVDARELFVAYDSHPQYATTAFALQHQARDRIAVQHHHAHIASVLAERGELDRRLLGVAFDGTGYGEDGTIWGGEFFIGSVTEGFQRVAHLRAALLPGGDASSRFPPQAAAGYLTGLDVPDLTGPPFLFPARYAQARQLVERRVRTFPTTSMGRLFDTAAALLGFTRELTFEGQAAIWLENIARRGNDMLFSIPFRNGELDYRPALSDLIAARIAGREIADIAFSFHAALARGTAEAIESLVARHGVDAVVLSGGVFQNALLIELLRREIERPRLTLLMNSHVPPNDAGLSLGQAALAAVVTAR
ncbi:MAG TPA: carbamoyltransferase HypF [Gemmatimonadaceae bacterium]|nr:carbamoyltransferase HypF [Gemmatimonadaceae bacterium]